jgi:hypothetical protein
MRGVGAIVMPADVGLHLGPCTGVEGLETAT